MLVMECRAILIPGEAGGLDLLAWAEAEFPGEEVEAEPGAVAEAGCGVLGLLDIPMLVIPIGVLQSGFMVPGGGKNLNFKEVKNALG